MHHSALVILGMHRSGTSAVSRAVSFWGFAQPTDQVEPGCDNPKGFWEPQGVVALNERVLTSLAAGWSRPGPFRIGALDLNTSRVQIMQALGERYSNEAARVLRRSYPEARPIVLKDPRLSVLWPLWDAALERSGFVAHYLLVFRNPLDVVASLHVRNWVPRAPALRLWLLHAILALEAATTGRFVGVVEYETLLANPERALSPLLAGLAPPIDGEQGQALKAFVSDADRHFRTPANEVERSPILPDIVKYAYQLLREWDAIPSERRLERALELADRFQDVAMLAGDVINVQMPLTDGALLAFSSDSVVDYFARGDVISDHR